MALQWEGVIATAAESGGASDINGRMYCDISRSNNTISVTNIYMGHSLSSGYDNDPWQTDMWANTSLRLSATQTKGTTSGTISGNWYYSGAASHSFGVGTEAGVFNLQGNWRQALYGYVAATRTQSVAYPAAGSPTIDSKSASEETMTSAKITWTSSNGTYCDFASMVLEYGLTASYGSIKTGLSADSNTTLTGLAPGTTYHYRMKITNGAGLVGYSADATFTTKPVGFFDSDL